MEPLPQGTSRRKSESLKGRRDDVLLQPRAEADAVSVGDGELEDPEKKVDVAPPLAADVLRRRRRRRAWRMARMAAQCSHLGRQKAREEKRVVATGQTCF